VPASSLQEEACAAAGALSAEGFAAAERVGSGSARADWVQDERFRVGYSAVARAGVHCAPVARLDDSSGDESAQADCLVDLAGYSVVLSADDSSLGGYSELADSAVPQEGDSSPVD